jgi:hypothetical protein
MLEDHDRESHAPGRREIAPCLGVLGLTYGEHLLVWTLRRLVARRGSCPLIAHEFTEVFGEDGEETLSILRIFLGLLGTAARRRLSFGHPGWPGVTSDEQRLLSLISAAQVENAALLEAHLAWLARIEARRPLALATRGLAAAFAEHDLGFSPVAAGRSGFSAPRAPIRLVS